MASFFVAFEVVVLYALPDAVLVDVADDLASVDAGDELHRLIALCTCCCAARLDGANDCPAF